MLLKNSQDTQMRKTPGEAAAESQSNARPRGHVYRIHCLRFPRSVAARRHAPRMTEQNGSTYGPGVLKKRYHRTAMETARDLANAA